LVNSGLADTDVNGNYIGYLQNFFYNERDMFEYLQSLPPDYYNVQWLYLNGRLPVQTYLPVTISSHETYVRLASMRLTLRHRILFKFRTTESSGLIMYHDGNNNEFMAVELDNGRIRYLFDMGGGPTDIPVNTPNKLNDGKWHVVEIMRMSETQHRVRVDETATTVSAQGGEYELDLAGGSLYIAGLPAGMFKRSHIQNVLKSRQGFMGCLASLDLNGAVVNLKKHALNNQFVIGECLVKYN
jgi:neurexin